MKPTARRRVDARRRPSRAHHPSSRAPPTRARALARSRPGRASHLELDPPLPRIRSRTASIRPVSRLGRSLTVCAPRSTASETTETRETTREERRRRDRDRVDPDPDPDPATRDERRETVDRSIDRSRSRSIESRTRSNRASYLRGDGGARDALVRARGSRRERDQSGVQRQGDHGACVSSASDDVTRRVRLAHMPPRASAVRTPPFMTRQRVAHNLSASRSIDRSIG